MANKLQQAMEIIKADTQLKESTKRYLSDNRSRKRSPWSRPAFRWVVAAACFMLLVAAAGGGYRSWREMTVSYVSIDVNPSLELALNRYNEVVSATAYNKEGEQVIEGLSLKGKKYTEAIHLIVESEAMRPYLTDKAELVLTVAADSSRESELKNGVESVSGQNGYNTYSVSTDVSIASEAHGHHLSVGKYYAYLELSQYDDTVTVDDCRHMSMSEIHVRIEEHCQEGGHHTEEYQDSQNDIYQEEGYYGGGEQYHGHHGWGHH